MNKKVLILFYFFYGFLLIGIQAQTLHVKKRDGTNIFNRISEVNRISFKSDTIVLDIKNREKILINVIDIQNIDFIQNNSDDLKYNIIKDSFAILFPNPSNGYINIALNTSECNNFSIEILSINGTVLYLKNEQIKESNSIYNLNIMELPSGLYFCRIIYSDKIQIIKFINSNN